jgi:hypothetical protein
METTAPNPHAAADVWTGYASDLGLVPSADADDVPADEDEDEDLTADSELRVIGEVGAYHAVAQIRRNQPPYEPDVIHLIRRTADGSTVFRAFDERDAGILLQRLASFGDHLAAAR